MQLAKIIPSGKPRAVSLLVLDIDGTVREGKDDALGKFVNGPEDVRVFPEAVALMREWKERGGRIIGASNQGGIALGYLTIEDAQKAMLETVNQCEGLFDMVSICRHHPDAKDPEYARCWCRKPAPGLIIESAIRLANLTNEMYPPHLGLFVGDREEDAVCAELCGMDFMHAHDWRSTAVL